MSNENTDQLVSDDVEFGPLREALREHQYPVTRAELVEVYGGFELEFSEGTDRLEDVLTRVDETSFRDPRDVKDAILTGLAVGVGLDPVLKEDDSSADDWSRKSV